MCMLMFKFPGYIVFHIRISDITNYGMYNRDTVLNLNFYKYQYFINKLL